MQNNSVPPAWKSRHNHSSPAGYERIAVSFLIAMFLFCIEAPALALDEGVIENVAPDSQDQLLQDIDGSIVVDNTITMIAHEFYQHFMKFWRDQPASATHNLTIHERPTAAWGSIVWIEHDSKVIFRANLFSARSKTESVAETAANSINQQLEQMSLQQLLFDDPDLTKEGY
jgi:curli production assembly/transport component CsgE